MAWISIVHAGEGAYGLGRVAEPAQIAAWDIAIGPQGKELPPGSGSVEAGRVLYQQRCAMCHGATGIEGPDHILVGGQGSLASDTPLLTIGSYWRYATSLYDYIYRAMPFVAPGSLQSDEVYALCAFLLNANGIVDDDAVLDRASLAAIVMPNRDNFIADPRPDTHARGD